MGKQRLPQTPTEEAIHALIWLFAIVGATIGVLH